MRDHARAKRLKKGFPEGYTRARSRTRSEEKTWPFRRNRRVRDHARAERLEKGFLEAETRARSRTRPEKAFQKVS